MEEAMQDGYGCNPVEPVKSGLFKLEAVVVCANYSDFLRETLPHNKQMSTRWWW